MMWLAVASDVRAHEPELGVGAHALDVVHLGRRVIAARPLAAWMVLQVGRAEGDPIITIATRMPIRSCGIERRLALPFAGEAMLTWCDVDGRTLGHSMKGAAVREHERPKSREETPKEGGGRRRKSRTAHPMNAKSPTIGRMIGLNSKGVTSLEGYMGERPFRAQSR
jgi:hypothetical protein